ncbi:hypothetical protein GWK47_000346 [Chionoecetes opilio]|uniref:RNase H type-1 domain-containing protein n=1 Tax=Chionoecetes opilio TaxID=41210 RepID=A0A8J5D222_CHIOP|nr:hypothetical protein GWK47_000346 [Chionoecetes opilio]
MGQRLRNAERDQIGAPPTGVQCIMACRVARVFRRDVEGVAQRRLRRPWRRASSPLRGNTGLINTSLATHSLIHGGITGPWRGADVPVPTYYAPPPWGPPAAIFTATQLPACKAYGLVAIQHALEHALHRREATVVIHTDSWTGLQALQQPHPKDNVRLSPPSWKPTEPWRAGKACQLNWIPSHVGVRGNKAADVAAKRAASGPQRHQGTCLPAYSS